MLAVENGTIILYTQLQVLEWKEDKCHPPLATQLLVLMVRGIFFKLQFPYAHFATRGITADLLFPMIWEAVREIELIGLKVIFITADGASSNRNFFRMHKGPNKFTSVQNMQFVFRPKEAFGIFLFRSSTPHEDDQKLLVSLSCQWNTTHD